MSEKDAESEKIKEILSQNATPPEFGTDTPNAHPMAVVLWILAILNPICGIYLGANSRQLFGNCRYGGYSCDATAFSELMTYAWVVGIGNFIILGAFAVVIDLLHRIAVSTSSK